MLSEVFSPSLRSLREAGWEDGVLNAPALTACRHFYLRTAPENDRTLAAGHGSDLLSRKLHWQAGRVARFFAPPSRKERPRVLPRPLRSPARGCLSDRALRRIFRRGEAAPAFGRTGLHSSNFYPLGNCVGGPDETADQPDSVRRGL